MAAVLIIITSKRTTLNLNLKLIEYFCRITSPTSIDDDCTAEGMTRVFHMIAVYLLVKIVFVN